MSYSIPHLYVTGTNYEVGHRTVNWFNIKTRISNLNPKNKKGLEFRQRIVRYIEDFEEFHSQIVPFIQTEFGKKVLYDYYNLINEKYPWYAEEIKGIADGSEISFEWVSLLA